jgi:universal stress protein F
VACRSVGQEDQERSGNQRSGPKCSGRRAAPEVELSDSASSRHSKLIRGRSVMYKNILIPVILDKLHDTQASYLVARALAGADTSFTVLHVIEAIPEYVASQIPGDVLDGARHETEQALKQSAAALPGAKTQLVYGHAGRFILDFAHENNFDCIIMASHRPGLEDYFLGSTAARVVRHARCSVHVIR